MAEKEIGPPGIGSPIGKRHVMMVGSSLGGESIITSKFHKTDT